MYPSAGGSRSRRASCVGGGGDQMETGVVEYMDPTEDDCDDGVGGALRWEEFFGSSLELVPILLDMYDSLVAKQHYEGPETPTNSGRNSATPTSRCPHSSRNNSLSRRMSVPPPHSSSVELMEYEASPWRDRRSLILAEDNDDRDRDRENNVPELDNCKVGDVTMLLVNGGSAGEDLVAMDVSDGTPLPDDTVPTVSQNCNEETHSPTRRRHCKCKRGKARHSETLDSGFGDQPVGSTGDVAWEDAASLPGKRPLSISSSVSSSSASSSSSLTRNHSNKKSYLASIESLDDADADLSDEGVEEKVVPRARVPAVGGGGAKDGLGSSPNGGVPCGLPSSSSTLGRPKYCDPSLSYTDRVVLEIVESERTYVRDIGEIIEGYLGFVRTNSGVNIGEEDSRDLFGNIEAIYTFNSGLLEELEQCGLDPMRVAQCFVQHNEGFAVYTHYCTNYPRTVSVLTELMRKKETAEIFRERQASLSHTLPLGSYLLKPVQRILKYHLLLQNIVKHYDQTQVGYEVIVNALATMTGMAHHINDMKRRHEHAVRVQEIQSLLFGWQGQDLTTYGELVAEGMFRMFGAKAVRHVFLFDKMLLIAKKKEGGYLSYKTHIMCSNLMLIESIPREPLCFHVIPFDNPRVQYTLQARSLEQKREWTLQLKRVILENYHAVIPYHARQLVMQLGQNRPEDELLVEKGTNTKRQHSAPEYLEKRKHEKDRRKSESSLNRALRIRKGSKKSDSDVPPSPSIEARGRRNRSCRETGERSQMQTDAEQKVNSAIPELVKKKSKEKKSKGWRRKSEPNDFMSSKESIVLSPSKKAGICKQNSLQECCEETAIGVPVAEVKNSPCKRENGHSSAFALIEALLRPQSKKTVQPVEETTDTENEDHASYQRQWQSSESSHYSSQEADDPNSDYVTFYFTQQHLQKQTLSPMSPSSSVASPTTEFAKACLYNGIASVDNLREHQVLSPTKSVSSRSTASSIASTPGSYYDNLLNIWANMGWLNLEKTDGSKSTDSLASNKSGRSLRQSLCLRRAQSFNSQSSIREATGSATVRRSLRARPNRLNLGPPLSLPMSPDSTGSPTTPAVWLKQQGDHLAEVSKKSGSLPRSFQLGNEPRSSRSSSTESSLHDLSCTESTCKSRLRADRPFTIASDKPSQSDLNLDDFEHFMHESPSKRQSYRFPVSRDESEERVSTTGCTSTPAESMEDISGPIHPEHRIYRSSLSKSSLRAALATVSARLSHLKSGTSIHSDTGSCSNVNSDTDEVGQHRSRSREKDRVTHKLMNTMAKMYSKMMKQRIRAKVDEKGSHESVIPCTQQLVQTGLPFYRQGSPAIGARMASPIEQCDYSVPRHRRPIRKADDVRPDSVLSVSSNITSSSDGDKTSGFGGSVDTSATPCDSTINLQISEDSKTPTAERDKGSDSDGSGDSYYERSFEAIEGLLENEIFRDSAIYSDPDELDAVPGSLSPERPTYAKTPPPRPFKPIRLREKRSYSAATTPEYELSPTVDVASRRVRGHCIMEKLRHLEASVQYRRDDLASNSSQDGFKSIEQRRKDLELWQSGSYRDADESETSSQHSTSTINTVVELSGATIPPSSPSSSHTTMKGWVKHVVGKFQEKT